MDSNLKRAIEASKSTHILNELSRKIKEKAREEELQKGIDESIVEMKENQTTRGTILSEEQSEIAKKAEVSKFIETNVQPKTATRAATAATSTRIAELLELMRKATAELEAAKATATEARTAEARAAEGRAAEARAAEAEAATAKSKRAIVESVPVKSETKTVTMSQTNINRERKTRILAKKRHSENDKIALAEIERRQISSHIETELLPVLPREAGGGGDCFYHSIIECATESGVYDLLATLTNSRDFSDDRHRFIQGIRNFISDNIDVRAGLVFNRLQSIKTKNLGEIIKFTFSEWHKAAFANAIRTEGSSKKAVFISNIKQGIRQMGNDVREIEVEFLKEYLRNFSIIVETHTAVPKRLSKIINGNPVLHLLNLGDYHWQFLTFITYGGKKQYKSRRKNKQRKIQTRKQRK